jgi:putative ubiquitin-RnfH superfamily antitoxin RatB of RatAB toxin-antitoxin module
VEQPAHLNHRVEQSGNARDGQGEDAHKKQEGRHLGAENVPKFQRERHQDGIVLAIGKQSVPFHHGNDSDDHHGKEHVPGLVRDAEASVKGPRKMRIDVAISHRYEKCINDGGHRQQRNNVNHSQVRLGVFGNQFDVEKTVKEMPGQVEEMGLVITD